VIVSLTIRLKIFSESHLRVINFASHLSWKKSLTASFCLIDLFPQRKLRDQEQNIHRFGMEQYFGSDKGEQILSRRETFDFDKVSRSI